VVFVVNCSQFVVVLLFFDKNATNQELTDYFYMLDIYTVGKFG